LGGIKTTLIKLKVGYCLKEKSKFW